MMYFLDFDRTLFDTDAFTQYLHNREGSELVEYDTLAFDEGELSSFVYADVAEFLRYAGNEATIITYGSEMFQRAKIKSALVGIPRLSVFYTGEVRKGEYLAPRLEFYGESVLVDDTILELEIAAERCPTLRLFRMDRSGAGSEERWEVITSLSELP